MKINYSLDLTDTQLQVISGKKRNATRKEVRAWLDQLVFSSLNGFPPLPNAIKRESDPLPSVGVSTTMGQTCTPMDHVFPLRHLPPDKGTPCYCNKRAWGESERQQQKEMR